VLAVELAKRYLPALDSFMRSVVDTLPDSADFKTMLHYPLGWVNADGAPYQGSTGKRIRPILLLLCTEAVGGDWHAALPAAAAVEFLHNFSLIHDDIQDNSPTRHNRPTVWSIWGRAQAINAGDTMFALAYEALARLSATTTADIALACWTMFNRTNLELTRGQYLDMHFETQTVVTEADYISMVSGKTAALLSGSAYMGALIGTFDKVEADHFADFGLNLGIAFQIHDDILGIWGDASVTGKSTATDILSRKKSLPVLYGLANNPDMITIYKREPFGELDVIDAVAALDKIDALDYARTSESSYFERAIDAVQQSASGGSKSFNDLLALTETLFQRQY